MSEKPRALGVIRLSVGNENQTGEETQRTRISKRADAEEMELVDFAVDIDVPASISPWVRPSLGDWLNNKKDQFDHIIILKIDRIARSIRHLSDIIEWCEANGKGLISCEEGFDLSKPQGCDGSPPVSDRASSEAFAIAAQLRSAVVASRVRPACHTSVPCLSLISPSTSGEPSNCLPHAASRRRPLAWWAVG
ncbi:recombinase family protein [Streptomyces sp. NPDC017179]|uniref:recombinase family protein n=1 Tax=Streptomyces sp. NPDC017179 TaxID=3364979 RepID=UPI0037B8B32F